MLKCDRFYNCTNFCNYNRKKDIAVEKGMSCQNPSHLSILTYRALPAPAAPRRNTIVIGSSRRSREDTALLNTVHSLRLRFYCFDLVIIFSGGVNWWQPCTCSKSRGRCHDDVLTGEAMKALIHFIQMWSLSARGKSLPAQIKIIEKISISSFFITAENHTGRGSLKHRLKKKLNISHRWM